MMMIMMVIIITRLLVWTKPKMGMEPKTQGIFWARVRNQIIGTSRACCKTALIGLKLQWGWAGLGFDIFSQTVCLQHNKQNQNF